MGEERNMRQKRKRMILCLGVVLYFLTTMSKVLVPATILDELLALGTLSMSQIAMLGGAFWYAYAASQLLSGIFSDRYGGVRILLIGGTSFALGSCAFPLLDKFPLMLAARIIAGFGAGTVFLGIAKLLADVFPEKFSTAMGFVLFAAFLGTPCGTSPMTALVKATNWRLAMLLPGLLALTLLLCMALLAKGTITPARRGNALLPLGKMMHNRVMWRLCISESLMFGAYYMVIMLVGKKSLTDFGMSAMNAAQVMLILTLFVAGMTMGVNFILKCFGNRRKVTALFGALCTLFGAIAGFASFCGNGSRFLLILAFFMLAIPGGFFALFSTMGKELNPPEDVGLAVAAVNFMAALFIAAFQNLGGVILGGFSAEGAVLPMVAYRTLFGVEIFLALIALVLMAWVPETNPPKRDAEL